MLPPVVTASKIWGILGLLSNDFGILLPEHDADPEARAARPVLPDLGAYPVSSRPLLDGHRFDASIVLRYTVCTRYYHITLTGRLPMTVVTISSRFQVVIPKDVRERLKLQPGQQVEAIPFKGRIELIPLEPIEAMRGFLRGIDTTVPREDDRA